MKELPLNLGKEELLNVDYAICRFMNSRKAFRIDQGAKGTILSFKRIQEKNLPEQVQIHFRFNGEDKWFGGKETVDCDIYVNVSEFKKLLEMIK